MTLPGDELKMKMHFKWRREKSRIFWYMKRGQNCNESIDTY